MTLVLSSVFPQRSMHTFPPLNHSDVSMSRHARCGDVNAEAIMGCNNRKGHGQRPTLANETSERLQRSVAHDSIALPVLTIRNRAQPKANHVLRQCQELRDSEKTHLCRQPHKKAQQNGSSDPSLSTTSTHKKRDDTSDSMLHHNNNSRTMMISPTISTRNMKHHDQSSWEDSVRPSRSRSRAIAIKPSPRRETGDNDFPDYSDQAARMYDDSTWAMYLRIVEYRQKHPASSPSNNQARTEIPMNRLNDDNITTGEERGLHGKEEPRGVNFYDADEEEIFDMEL
uniref:Uncharacterized protein n=1 Tax=Amphora coffeiformis TaxID=265554 RepID=A0A7S3L1C3_9STRA|mmetsp:Transcript_5091/g.9724  ORF Transcript_5091/g.9724 Transcript_5091/m.9724 type:complete len:284 (-) Transcript_5091:232-1083(-)|eukprot:scaffold3224_cov158-Amphora_coffeaeformis.AAC.26